MTRVKTTDARAALEQLIRERATEAAGTNTTVSRAEQASLDPFLGRAADEVRAAGGKGARVTVDGLTARATTGAAAVWDQANPPGHGANSAWLSQAEVKAVAQADPALGALSKLAYLRVSQAAPGGDAAAQVRAFFDGFDFHANEETGAHALHQGLPGATTIDARPGHPEGRAGLPAGVLQAYDVYGRAMEADWATVSLQRAKIAGHDVFVVYCTTDGDRSFLEVLDKKGKPLTSARISADALVGWDEAFGRTRFAPQLVALEPPAQEEGLSEPADIAAAGQVPHDWAGDVAITQGRLEYGAYYELSALDLPAAHGTPQLEVAAAAFEYLWETSLKHRVLGSQEPFLLGDHREGTMIVGDFTRNDGKTYEVAQWRDIDDGSFTLYFERAAGNRLRLATVQFDN